MSKAHSDPTLDNAQQNSQLRRDIYADVYDSLRIPYEIAESVETRANKITSKVLAHANHAITQEYETMLTFLEANVEDCVRLTAQNEKLREALQAVCDCYDRIRELEKELQAIRKSAV
jgi:hypothetical protein